MVMKNRRNWSWSFSINFPFIPDKAFYNNRNFIYLSFYMKFLSGQIKLSEYYLTYRSIYDFQKRRKTL